MFGTLGDLIQEVQDSSISIEAWITSIDGWTTKEKFTAYEDALSAAVKELAAYTQFSDKGRSKTFTTLASMKNLHDRIVEVHTALSMLESYVSSTALPDTRDMYRTFAKSLSTRIKGLPTFGLIMEENTRLKDKRRVKKYRIYLPKKKSPRPHAAKSATELGYTEGSFVELYASIVKMNKDVPADVRRILKKVKSFDAAVKKSIGLEVVSPDEPKRWHVDMSMGLVEAAVLFTMIRLPYVIYDILADVRQLATAYDKQST